MAWAQFPGGSGPPPQYNDQLNNDGDGSIDFPNDPRFTGPNDIDERNR